MIQLKSLWKFALPIVAALVVSACSTAGSAPRYAALPPATTLAGTPLPTTSSLPSAPTGSDLIAPQDLVAVTVFKVPDLSKEVRVDDSGNITLALIGSVKAAGLTASQLEQQIAARLEKDYMNNPQVNVLVKESTRNKVTVGGAVNKPGVFTLAGDTTVTQAIAMAEGLNKLAVKDNITLFRNGKPYSVQLDAISKGLQPDPLLLAGDKIQVHTSGTKETIDNMRGVIAPFTIF